MTQADRYDQLHYCLHNKELDSSYQAALYILSSNEEITEEVIPYLSLSGIDFAMFIKEAEYTGSDAVMVQLAYNLFRGESERPPTPHDLAVLGYPHIEIALEAICIASGLHKVVIEHDKNRSPVLSIDISRQESASKWYAELKQYLWSSHTPD